MGYNLTFCLSVVFIMLSSLAFADETNSSVANETIVLGEDETNSTNNDAPLYDGTNTTETPSLEDTNSTSQANATSSEEVNITDDSALENISNTLENTAVINESIIIEDNVTNNVTEDNSTVLVVEQIQDLTLLTVSPIGFPQGDIILTLDVENTGTETLTNIFPLVTGNGFSTYQVVSLDSLAPGESGILYVFSHLSKTGDILLTINIVDKTFYQTITVTKPVQEDATATQEDLATLSALATSLEEAYVTLETEMEAKSEKYMIPEIALDDIKTYIREAQSHILAGNVEQANISLILAEKVYLEEKAKLESAEKKSLFDLIKENIILISSFIGAIITLLTFYEYMRRKQAGIYQKIKEFKVNADTKIEVFKKKKSENDDGEVLEEDNILLKGKK